MWLAVVAIAGALMVGLIISAINKDLGWPYLSIFIIASLCVVLFTEARGLAVTITTIPIFFAVFTVLTSWIVTNQNSRTARPFATTTLVSSVYPLAQLFVVLLGVTVTALIIGMVRIWLLNKKLAAARQRARAERYRDAENNRANMSVTTKARAQANRVQDPRVPKQRARPTAGAGYQRSGEDFRRRSDEPRMTHSPRTTAPRPAAARRADLPYRAETARRDDVPPRRQPQRPSQIPINRSEREPLARPTAARRHDTPPRSERTQITVEELLRKHQDPRSFSRLRRRSETHHHDYPTQRPSARDPYESSTRETPPRSRSPHQNRNRDLYRD